jgi:pimeloyl-ACP methyl ester carboxylesterase
MKALKHSGKISAVPDALLLPPARPHARFVEFADAGHSPDLEDEERFADLALALLAEAA